MNTPTIDQLRGFVKANIGKDAEVASRYITGGGKIVGYSADDLTVFLANSKGEQRGWFEYKRPVYLDGGSNSKVVSVYPRYILAIDGKQAAFEVNNRCILFGVSSGSNGKSKYKVRVEKKELFSESKRFVDMEIEGHTLRDARVKSKL